MIIYAEVRAIPKGDTSKKFARLVSVLRKLPSPWCFEADPKESAAMKSTDNNRLIKLKKYCKSLVRFDVSYTNPDIAEDADYDDDYLVIEFDTKKADYPLFVKDCFPKIVDGFGAYYAECASEDAILSAADDSEGVNQREEVERVFPVAYFGDALCQNAFGKTASQIAELAEPVCFQVGLKKSGVLIVATEEIPTEAVAKKVHRSLFPILKGKKAAKKKST